MAIGIWVARLRDTDRSDPRAKVRSEFTDDSKTQFPKLRFHEVSQECGIDFHHGPGRRSRTLPEDTGSGVAFGDYDGDGDPDLYLVNIPNPDDPQAGAPNRLYRNDGGHFVDVSVEAGVEDSGGFGMGASFADFDGDGDLDLYVTNYGKNRLFRNCGPGEPFEEVAEEFGVADPAWSCGAAWGDFDRDGDLDLYVCNYLDYDPSLSGEALGVGTQSGGHSVPYTLNPNSFDPQPNRLYRNDGDRFRDVSNELGVRNPEGRSLTATFCDLDGDGWLDLYVNNDVSPNRLFRNPGATKNGVPKPFFDLSTITGVADPRGSMGLSIGEIGDLCGAADGLPDIFITHWVAQENAIYQSLKMGSGVVEYRDRTRRMRLGEISIDCVGWGCSFADLDRDGRIDIIVANGSTLEERANPAQLIADPLHLFWNGGERFHEASEAIGDPFTTRFRARGLATADFDLDGDLDIAISQNRGPFLLLRNDTETNNRSLSLTLKASDALCFGARVKLTQGDTSQYHWFASDVSYLSMHGRRMIFGLGENDAPCTVEVRWADGSTSTHQVRPGKKNVLSHP